MCTPSRSPKNNNSKLACVQNTFLAHPSWHTVINVLNVRIFIFMVVFHQKSKKFTIKHERSNFPPSAQSLCELVGEDQKARGLTNRSHRRQTWILILMPNLLPTAVVYNWYNLGDYWYARNFSYDIDMICVFRVCFRIRNEEGKQGLFYYMLVMK